MFFPVVHRHSFLAGGGGPEEDLECHGQLMDFGFECGFSRGANPGRADFSFIGEAHFFRHFTLQLLKALAAQSSMHHGNCFLPKEGPWLDWDSEGPQRSAKEILFAWNSQSYPSDGVVTGERERERQREIVSRDLPVEFVILSVRSWKQ